MNDRTAQDEALQNEVETLREHVRVLRAALELFCQRRERGEIQSSTTYKQFKQLLILTQPHP